MATNKITKQDRQAFADGVAQMQELSADFEKKLDVCRACVTACQLSEKSAAESWKLFMLHVEDIDRARIRSERAARRAELCLKTAVVSTLIYILFCFFGHGH